MKWLSYQWLTEPIIDFEFKKYTALAFLQSVRGELDACNLYPYWPDIKRHTSHLQETYTAVTTGREQWQSELYKASLKPPKLVYKSRYEVDPVMNELTQALEYVLPLFEQSSELANRLHESLWKDVQIEPIGLQPIRITEGYFFVPQNKDVRIYQYQFRLLSSPIPEEQYRNVYTSYVCSESRSLACPLEKIKLNLVKLRPELPNPAVWLVHSATPLPIAETLMPIAKEKLLHYAG